MNSQLFDIKGKVAIVTGATGGLGRVFVKTLCESGAIVILSGSNSKKLEDYWKELKENGHKVYKYCFNVNDSKSVNDAISDITDNIGYIDILINNAGITIRKELENFSESDWDKILGVNLSGAFKVSKEVVKGMIKNKSGKIINIGSLQCELGRPGITPYAVSKGGLQMLTRGMATEWGKYNIQCNGIAPGYFKTDLTINLFNDPIFNNWVCDRTPTKRWGEVDELSGILLLLSSGASNYINGQMIYVDGGLIVSV